jgi:phage-related protein
MEPTNRSGGCMVRSKRLRSHARLDWKRLLLRRLQQGESVSLPHSRPLPNIGARCHELRVRDENKNWRIVYRTDEDRVLIVEVFKKTTRQTPDAVIKVCQRRLIEYDRARRVE